MNYTRWMDNCTSVKPPRKCLFSSWLQVAKLGQKEAEFLQHQSGRAAHTHLGSWLPVFRRDTAITNSLPLPQSLSLNRTACRSSGAAQPPPRCQRHGQPGELVAPGSDQTHFFITQTRNPQTRALLLPPGTESKPNALMEKVTLRLACAFPPICLSFTITAM